MIWHQDITISLLSLIAWWNAPLRLLSKAWQFVWCVWLSLVLSWMLSVAVLSDSWAGWECYAHTYTYTHAHTQKRKSFYLRWISCLASPLLLIAWLPIWALWHEKASFSFSHLSSLLCWLCDCSVYKVNYN